MRVLPMSLISAVVLQAASWPALSDDVPELNVDAVCRGIAQQAKDPGERGGPDLAYSACVKSEQAMRQKLSKEWGTFAPAEKSHCTSAPRKVATRATPISSPAWKWHGTREK